MSDFVSEKEALEVWPRAGRTIKAQREEIDRLRAELEARDKAVPVMYVLEENGTIYPAESGETVEQVEDLAKARHCKGDRHRIVPLYTHPPRQAVPDGGMLFPVKAWRFLCGETAIFPPAGEGVWFGDEVVDPKTGRPQPFWWRSHIRAMLTAAPEAQQGDVVVTWTPDRQRIAAVTRQDSAGRILSVIAEAPEARSSEAEIQAEALEKRAASFERRANDLAYHGMSEGAIQSYEKQAAKCRDEAARLREGEK